MNATVNPAEPLINAVLAATSAQQAAAQSLIVSLITMVLATVTLCVFVYIAWKFAQLERNTNGMYAALIEATRKLALLEGNATGRAEQIAEQTPKSKIVSETVSEKSVVTINQKETEQK